MSGADQYDDETSGHGSSVRALTARVGTLGSLIVSIALLKTTDVTLDNVQLLTYKDFHSYKYMFYAMLIGLAYTVLQVPFAIYYMRRKKHMINNFSFLKFVFYADKVMVFVLATGVGAAFGATMDLKKVRWEVDNSRLQDFFTMIYVSAAFLLVGCLTSGISSVHSSLALSKF
ncbi:hypothetical protein ACJIZ3_010019 [Penstemon smallii]|uniref:CASP-like protein n=1 Tax=Penstemon smallii TaxID=265156 RepID=A0ABD3TFH7_9LAMI